MVISSSDGTYNHLTYFEEKSNYISLVVTCTDDCISHHLTILAKNLKFVGKLRNMKRIQGYTNLKYCSNCKFKGLFSILDLKISIRGYMSL